MNDLECILNSYSDSIKNEFKVLVKKLDYLDEENKIIVMNKMLNIINKYKNIENEIRQLKDNVISNNELVETSEEMNDIINNEKTNIMLKSFMPFMVMWWLLNS